jgi:hypothetical protein
MISKCAQNTVHPIKKKKNYENYDLRDFRS